MDKLTDFTSVDTQTTFTDEVSDASQNYRIEEYVNTGTTLIHRQIL